jgi:DNA-binding NtrC family response regulator
VARAILGRPVDWVVMAGSICIFVDNDPDFVREMERCLRAVGVRAVAVSDPADALAACAAPAIDVVIVELRPPLMLTTIKKPRGSLVVISASPSSQEATSMR